MSKPFKACQIWLSLWASIGFVQAPFVCSLDPEEWTATFFFVGSLRVFRRYGLSPGVRVQKKASDGFAQATFIWRYVQGVNISCLVGIRSVQRSPITPKYITQHFLIVIVSPYPDYTNMDEVSGRLALAKLTSCVFLWVPFICSLNAEGSTECDLPQVSANIIQCHHICCLLLSFVLKDAHCTMELFKVDDHAHWSVH